MLTIRLAFDRAGASAVRTSMAAAKVIAKPVSKRKFTVFDPGPLQRNVNKG
jgi:hypothetical protein